MNSDSQGLGLRAVMAKLASNSAVYGMAGILNRFASLLLLPFFTEIMTTSDYGILSLIALVTTASIGVFNLGTANSIGLLYFSQTDLHYRFQVIWTSAIFLAINCALFLALLWYISSFLGKVILGNDNYANLIQLALLSMSLSVIIDPFLAHLRMNNRAVAYVSLTLLSFGVTSGFSIWLVLFLKVGVIGILQAQFYGQALLFLLTLILVGKELKFSIDFRLIRPLVSIGFPSVIGSFATLLLVYSDRWLIEYFLGLDQLGVYSVGLSFGMFIAVLVGAFDTAWPPFFSSYVNRREEAKRVFPLVFTYFVFGFGIVTLAIFAVAKPVVCVLTAESFHEAWMVVGIVAFSQVLYGTFSVLGTGIYFSRKLGYISLLKWAVATINIVLNIILIPALGITGAAISMCVGYFLLSTITYFLSRIEFLVVYEWHRVSGYAFMLIVLMVVTWSSGYSLDMVEGSILNLFIFVLFLLYFWRWHLVSNERRFIYSTLLKLREK
ncbi:MAG: lipopolysaccharide biosynthesis protein [Magnetococcus sp. THC-1_WYH]